MTQTQLAELLERATADLSPSTDLVTGAITTGRRRRRRRLAVAAGAVVAAGVVGGAVLVLPGSGSGGDTVVADRSSTRSGTSVAAQPSAPSSAPAATSDGPFPVGPDAMASTLATLLHGTVTNPNNDQFHLAAPDGWQSGAVDLNGASVLVSYQRSTGSRCDGDLSKGDTSCTALGGGFFLATYSAEVTSTGVGKTGVRMVGVTYYTPSGYKINATASNGSGADPTTPTMDQPVLGVDGLTAIAENPLWR